ncbi:MAG TPA: ATP-binding protein [Anaeromyxobacteraceae bacterium]|nr:ATP-binding protein [Anaeromyxobacteraceae bacterium]
MSPGPQDDATGASDGRLRVAEALAWRTARLQVATAALSEALTPDQVAEATLTAGLAALGARGGALLVSGGPHDPVLLRSAGLSPEEARAVAAAPQAAETPAGAAFRTGVPVLVTGAEDLEARFPAAGPGGPGPLAAVPLVVAGRTLGVLGLVFGARGPLDAGEAALAGALATQCALALERARLFVAERLARAEAEAARRRLAFLDDVAALFAGTLDENEMLEGVVRIAVPALGDFAAAWRRADGELEPVTRAGSEPLGADVDAALTATGGQLARAEQEQLRLPLRGGGEAVLVPLRARDRCLGVLLLASAESVRRYGPADLALVAHLGRRTALSVDHARLFREAQASVSARDEFLQIASHELRGPLAAVRLVVQSTARLPGVPAAVVARLERADRAVDRLARLVDALLDVSRITAGRLRLDREPVDLADVVRDVVARAAEEAAEAACAVTVAAAAPVTGTWDRGRIEQVVTNLLGNAIKYGRGKPVEVAVSAEGGRARLVVRDHGIGIDPVHRARIFERFERAVSSREYGGLGLGLWIVRSIVEAHGGAVSVASAPGAGSTFTVELPRG